MRSISDKVLLREGWKTSSYGHMRWKESTDHLSFSPRWARYRGVEVLAFEVSPRDSSMGPLTLTKTNTKKDSPEDVNYVRQDGDVGRVIQVAVDKVEEWWSTRRLDKSSRRFRRWINELQRTDSDKYNLVVSEYCSAVVEATDSISNLYVRLEGEVLVHSDKLKRRGFEPEEKYLDSKRTKSKPRRWRAELETISQEIYPLFLVGEPGAGKSTSFQAMARGVCQKRSSEENCWALVVPLAGYTSAGLQELVHQELPGLNWYDILVGLDSGDLTLLLDGLNECPHRHYTKCIEDIADLLQQYSEAKIYISTRRSHLPEYAQNVVEMRPMSYETQRTFVEKHTAQESDLAVSFWEALRKKPTAGLIVRNPMMLKMAVFIWGETGELPEGLATLYSEFFETCFRREMLKDLDANSLSVWTEEEVRKHLSLLAFTMRSRGLVSCSRVDAEEILAAVLGERARAFLQRYLHSFFFRKISAGVTIQFSHETIQEFLVAVFITHHADHKLISSEQESGERRWDMPIVFAFELFEQPPEHFVQTAWKIAPLLVCASMRDGERLKLLPELLERHSEPQNDLWVRGVVQTLRGLGIEDITQSLAVRGRTPCAKHPLPAELISALEGGAFWYALKTFEDGRERLELVQHLLIDKTNLWLELLPHAVRGQPEWLEHLDDTQKLIVGELGDGDINTEISDASVSELCYMFRNNIIPKETFRKNWKIALNDDNHELLGQELLALLTTNKFDVGQLNGKQKSKLKKLGGSVGVSPRFVYVLVKDRIVKKEDIRQNRESIKRLADVVSPIRAKQLASQKILVPEDFNDLQKQKLLERIERQTDILHVLDSGIIKSRKEIPSYIINRAHEFGKKSEIDKSSNLDVKKSEAYEGISKAEVENIFKSKEQMSLEQACRDAQDPVNFAPGNGYHHVLVKLVQDSAGWPHELRVNLVDLADRFFSEHKSKKRYAEHKGLIAEARASLAKIDS